MPCEYRVLLIGGTSHAGKSTLAQALASQLGWSHRSTDTLARHPGRPWKPRPQQVPPHVADHYLSLPVDELLADVLRHYRDNVWPLAREIITQRATALSSEGLVMEGSALLPELVTALTLENVASVWLTASDELYERRIYAASQYSSRSAREKQMIDKFLARTCVYNAQMTRTAERLGMTSIDVERAANLDDLVRICLSLLEKPDPGIQVHRIHPTQAGVAELLKQSTEYASSLYPAESNHLDSAEELSQENVYLVGAFSQDVPVGIGAVKRLVHDVEYGEIKRLFVLPAFRGNGLAKLIMGELEDHLRENGVTVSRLETGIYQPKAIGLYRRLGYRVRDPFGEYAPDPLSVFMEKPICDQGPEVASGSHSPRSRVSIRVIKTEEE